MQWMNILDSSQSGQSCKYSFWTVSIILEISATVLCPIEINSVHIKNQESEQEINEHKFDERKKYHNIWWQSNVSWINTKVVLILLDFVSTTCAMVCCFLNVYSTFWANNDTLWESNITTCAVEKHSWSKPLRSVMGFC